MLVIVVDLISVIIPTRNRCQRLQRAITSVQNQQWERLEIIVVDDASTDGTSVMLDQLAAEDARIHYICNQSPQGGGGARNIGIAAAQGQYVAFLDDDDQWFPQKLALQHAELMSNPEVSAVSCSFIIRSPDRRDRSKILVPLANPQDLLRANRLGGASVCFTSRDALQSVGGFDPLLKSGQDWDLWLKLYNIGEIRVCSEPLVLYVTHEDGRITGNFKAEYQGRRTIHLRYRLQMNAETRHHSLCEIKFFRQVIFRSSWWARIFGMCDLVSSAKGMNKLHFIYRLVKIALAGRHKRQI